MTGRALPELPVRRALPELLRALDDHGTAVLSAPTGSGKTTMINMLADLGHKTAAECSRQYIDGEIAKGRTV